MKSAYHTNSFRCDCCSSIARAVIELGCREDNPRACFRCLPRLFALVDLSVSDPRVAVIG